MTDTQKKPHAYGSTLRGIVIGIIGLSMIGFSGSVNQRSLGDYTDNLFNLPGGSGVLSIIALILTIAIAWTLFTEPRNPGRKITTALGLTAVGLALALPNGVDALEALGVTAFLIGADTYRSSSIKFLIPWVVLTIAAAVETLVYMPSAKTGTDLFADRAVSTVIVFVVMMIPYLVGRWWQKRRDARLAG